MEVDRELLERCIRGEREAFRRLVERHHQYAFSLAFRILCNEEDAKDVAQEAFIRVWSHMPSFDPDTRFTTWLYRIVVNLAYDRVRSRERRRQTPLEALDEAPHEDMSQDTELMNRDLAARIIQFAGSLPRMQRLVFVLRDLQACTVQETAQVLAISENAVKANLCIARRTIRAHMVQLEAREETR